MAPDGALLDSTNKTVLGQGGGGGYGHEARGRSRNPKFPSGCAVHMLLVHLRHDGRVSSRRQHAWTTRGIARTGLTTPIHTIQAPTPLQRSSTRHLSARHCMTQDGFTDKTLMATKNRFC